MPNIGHIGEFDPFAEPLDTYQDRVDEYFTANNIAIPFTDTVSHLSADRR